MGWNFFLALNNRLNHFFRAASLPSSSPPFQVFILNKRCSKLPFFLSNQKTCFFFSIFKFSYQACISKAKKKPWIKSSLRTKYYKSSFSLVFLNKINLVVGEMSFLFSVFQSTLPELEVRYVYTSVLFRFGLVFFFTILGRVQLSFSFVPDPTTNCTFFIVEIIFSKTPRN